MGLKTSKINFAIQTYPIFFLRTTLYVKYLSMRFSTYPVRFKNLINNIDNSHTKYFCNSVSKDRGKNTQHNSWQISKMTIKKRIAT